MESGSHIGPGLVAAPGGGLTAGFTPEPGFYDELFEAPGTPRQHAAALVEALDRMGPQRLRAAGERRDAIFVQQGITFDATGDDENVVDRPFPLDLIPRIIPAGEWTTIKRGLAQRLRALNRFIEDVYHDREMVQDGVVPWELIGHGRHYADVPPVKGVYRGAPSSELDVNVKMTKLGG